MILSIIQNVKCCEFCRVKLPEEGRKEVRSGTLKSPSVEVGVTVAQSNWRHRKDNEFHKKKKRVAFTAKTQVTSAAATVKTTKLRSVTMK